MNDSVSIEENIENKTNHSFGFIITRHVNNERSNYYWQECYRCIRMLYPTIMVLIIDDNSSLEHIKTFPTTPPLTNCIIIQSEFPKRGELLAYYYFLKIQPFERAIIIHDSIFIQSSFRLKHEKVIENIENVKFLWDFPHYYDDLEGEIPYFKMLGEEHLNYSKCSSELVGDILYFHKNYAEWRGCFGVMSIITLDFIKKLEEKFHLFKWFSIVKSRDQRYYIERVFAVLCCLEDRTACHSLLGDIYNYSIPWEYQWENYLEDKMNNKITNSSVVKVWSRR